jgi:hypothetical protein
MPKPHGHTSRCHGLSSRAATIALGVAALAPLAACVAEVLDSDVGPADDDYEYGLSEEYIAVPGNWNPPADVRAAGASEHIPYEGPPAWDGGAHCGSGLLAGTKQLGDFLKSQFAGRVSSYGGYACRQNTANKAETSVHGTGRALDVFIPMASGQADNTKGDEVANWLIVNAQSIGVQYIIWDRSDWSGDHGGDKMGRYTGPVPHTDHIHVEVTHAAANKQTPWFTGLGETGSGDGGSSGGGGGTGGTIGGSAGPGSCEVRSDRRLYCKNTAGAAMRAQPALDSLIVNRLRTTYSWFECWGTGEYHAGGNTTWYRTLGDDNANRGWIAGVDVGTSSEFDHDPSAIGLPHC